MQGAHRTRYDPLIRKEAKYAEDYEAYNVLMYNEMVGCFFFLTRTSCTHTNKWKREATWTDIILFSLFNTYI